MAIKQIKKLSIGEQVFEQLKQQILSNEWKRGEKIPSENDLAEALGVSRVTVRQAIQKLTFLGLLETRLGEGSFVKEAKAGMYLSTIIPIAYLGENSLREALEFRRAIEGVVAELAARKITDDDLDELEDLYQQMEEYRDNLETFSVADVAFHLCIARATKNSLFIEIFNIIHDVLRDAIAKVVTKRGVVAGLHYHKLLLEALRRRDPVEVKKIMDEHMEDTKNSFLYLEK